MSAKFVSSEIVEYQVKITLDTENFYLPVRRSDVGSYWMVYLPKGIKFTIQNLIETCEAVYDAKIFDEGHTCLLKEDDDHTDWIYIEGRENIQRDILRRVIASFPEKNY